MYEDFTAVNMPQNLNSNVFSHECPLLLGTSSHFLMSAFFQNCLSLLTSQEHFNVTDSEETKAGENNILEFNLFNIKEQNIKKKIKKTCSYMSIG